MAKNMEIVRTTSFDSRYSPYVSSSSGAPSGIVPPIPPIPSDIRSGPRAGPSRSISYLDVASPVTTASSNITAAQSTVNLGTYRSSGSVRSSASRTSLSSKPLPDQRWQTDSQRKATALYQKYNDSVNFSAPQVYGNSIKVVCISDTNDEQPVLPPSDILIHAGDLSKSGTFDDLQTQLDWLASQPCKHKILVGGHTDFLLDTNFYKKYPELSAQHAGRTFTDLNFHDIHFLNKTLITLSINNRNIRIYGSSETPTMGTWAFQSPMNRDCWTGTVPSGIDILVSHGPPKAHLDGALQGDEFLLKELWRVKPGLVVFGHIWAGYGQETLTYSQMQASFESVMMGKGGFGTIASMSRARFMQKLKGGSVPAGSGGRMSVTKLVNAAVYVDGQKGTTRPPVVVTI